MRVGKGKEMGGKGQKGKRGQVLVLPRGSDPEPLLDPTLPTDGSDPVREQKTRRSAPTRLKEREKLQIRVSPDSHGREEARCRGDSHLHRVPGDEDVLLVDVEVEVGDGGQVGRAPLIKVGDELEGEVGKLVAVGGQDEGAGGGKAQRGAVEGAEDAAARAHAQLGAAQEAAAHAVAERTLLLRLAASGVTLDQVPADAAAAFGAVAVPEELIGLRGRREASELC